jgi:hypothetical protein
VRLPAGWGVMATTDEILADPAGTAELPDGAIPLHVIVLIEYAEPGADERPGAPRLALQSDESLGPWTAIGMLHFAAELERDAV